MSILTPGFAAQSSGETWPCGKPVSQLADVVQLPTHRSPGPCDPDPCDPGAGSDDSVAGIMSPQPRRQLLAVKVAEQQLDIDTSAHARRKLLRKPHAHTPAYRATFLKPHLHTPTYYAKKGVPAPRAPTRAHCRPGVGLENMSRLVGCFPCAVPSCREDTPCNPALATCTTCCAMRFCMHYPMSFPRPVRPIEFGAASGETDLRATVCTRVVTWRVLLQDLRQGPLERLPSSASRRRQSGSGWPRRRNRRRRRRRHRRIRSQRRRPIKSRRRRPIRSRRRRSRSRRRQRGRKGPRRHHPSAIRLLPS